MYLSLLRINQNSKAMQHALAYPYQMHRTLMQAFPDNLMQTGDGRDQRAERILFRVDEGIDGKPLILVQSPMEPDWSAIRREHLIAPVHIKSFDLSLQVGQMLAFRLRANPTRRMQFGDAGSKATKKRIGIYKVEDQENWLRRKMEDGGLQIVQLDIRNGGRVLDKTRAYADGERHKLELLDVRFEGRLVVINPELAIQTIYAGIGSGKAFGYGLLSLARPN